MLQLSSLLPTRKHPALLISNMHNGVVLEICVESVDCALAAERGGAHRIELCSNLAVGGVTPTPELMRAVRRVVSLPIYVMVRPRRGNFCYTAQEFESMQEEIAATKQLGIDGIVLGVLDSQGQVDLDRTRKLVEVAHPLPVTFHRAFDDSADLVKALEAVIQTGAKRILTSGGREAAANGLAALSRLVGKAGDRIIIMPGGGVNERNVARIMRNTSAREVHSSLGSFDRPRASDQTLTTLSRMPGGTLHRQLELFEQRVRKLVELISSVDHLESPGRTEPN